MVSYNKMVRSNRGCGFVKWQNHSLSGIWQNSKNRSAINMSRKLLKKKVSQDVS